MTYGLEEIEMQSHLVDPDGFAGNVSSDNEIDALSWQPRPAVKRLRFVAVVLGVCLSVFFFVSNRHESTPVASVPKPEDLEQSWASTHHKLPFAFSLMAPKGMLAASLITAMNDPEPLHFLVTHEHMEGGLITEYVKQYPATLRAAPQVGPVTWYIDEVLYYPRMGFNASAGNPDTVFNFADVVYEAYFNPFEGTPITAAFVLGDGTQLRVPLPPRNPAQFVVVGDTGLRVKPTNNGWCAKKLSGAKDLYSQATCKAKDMLFNYHPGMVNGIFQSTADSIDPAGDPWPVKKVVAAAAASAHAKPSVVMHVGDYTYRHASCPTPFPKEPPPSDPNDPNAITPRVFGDCSGIGTDWGDCTDGWRADFFEPMAELLLAAPWIVIRGNHEVCKRGGMGWFRYLDPHPVQGPDALKGAHVEKSWCVSHTAPYKVEFQDDMILVMDNGQVKQHVSIDKYPVAEYTEAEAEAAGESEVLPLNTACNTKPEDTDASKNDFAAIESLAKNSTKVRTWIGMHRPIVGLLSMDKGGVDQAGAKLYNFDCEIANAAAVSGATITNVSGIISGHFHTFQVAEFDGDGDRAFPTMIIQGNSGTQLATPRHGGQNGMFRAKGRSVLGKEATSVQQVGEFGFGQILLAGPNPTLVAQFLSDCTFDGHEDVRVELKPQPFHFSKGYYSG